MSASAPADSVQYALSHPKMRLDLVCMLVRGPACTTRGSQVCGGPANTAKQVAPQHMMGHSSLYLLMTCR